MKKNSFYYYIHTFALLIVGVTMVFSNIGCCVECLQGGGKIENPMKKQQEVLVQKVNPQENKTGMILSFGKDTSKSVHNTINTIPAGGFKDLSVHYKIKRADGCPLGLDAIHTYFTAGPNMNFKSAGSDVYAGGSHKPGIGFQAGFRTVYRFSDKFSVVPGLLFKQNNASEEATISDGGPGEPGGGDPGISIVDKYSYNYLSAPILAQFNLTSNLTLSAGPELNYLLSAKVKSSTNYGGTDNKETRNITKESVKAGIGVQAGLKYEFPDSRWSMELVYDHRLSRLNKKPDDYPEYSPAWRMKSVQLGVKCRICDLVNGKKH